MTKSGVSRQLLGDLRRLIEEARRNVAQAVTSALVALYWKIGKRIGKEILKEARAEYGQKIVLALSSRLSAEFGNRFSEKNLRHMIRFAEAFPEEQIVSALQRQLGWTHLKQIIYFEDPLQREFYVHGLPSEWSRKWH